MPLKDYLSGETMMKQMALVLACFVAVTTSAQTSNSAASLQAVQNACTQLLASPENPIALQTLARSAAGVQDNDLKAAIMATYAMGMFCGDQLQAANTAIQRLRQTYPASPCLAAFQGSQYQADCPKCSGSGSVEGRCAQCARNNGCKFCHGKGTIDLLNGQSTSCPRCRQSGRCTVCNGSGRVTLKCPQCAGSGRVTSKPLMKNAYVDLIRQTQTLALQQERSAKGLIEFEGQWITPADKQSELNRREALAKAQQADSERKLAEEKRKQSEDTGPATPPQAEPGRSNGDGTVAQLQALADEGDAPAQYKLGVCYDNGQGLPRDRNEAAMWYRAAANKGHALAQYNLGVWYANGQDVDKDLQAAYGWLSLSSAAGTKEAAGALQYIEPKLSQDQLLAARTWVKEWKPGTAGVPVSPQQQEAHPRPAPEKLRGRNKADHGYTYETNGSTITITHYYGSEDEVNIPVAIDSLPVTRIGPRAFQHRLQLRSITIPNGVTDIGKEAFDQCTNLISAIIPNTVTNIGNKAFSECFQLRSITIPHGMTNIGDEVFSFCTNLTSVTIPNSVTRIGKLAFALCTSLTSVTIPNSVTHIGDGAFAGCSQLRSMTIPNGVTHIGNGAFAGCSQLRSMTIPNGVTHIGDGAFAQCTRLTGITIPDSVTLIGRGPFTACTSLSAITVDARNPVYSSEEGVLFDKRRKRLIQYPHGSTAPTYAIPHGVTSVVHGAFSRCTSLTTLMISADVNLIEDAFNGCASLTAFIVDKKNATFSSVDGILLNKSQNELVRCPENKAGNCTIPASVNRIESSAFLDCASLTTLEIPAAVNYMEGCFGFRGCTNLVAFIVDKNNATYGSADGILLNKSQDELLKCPYNKTGNVAIPESVITVADAAFFGCSNLTSITIPRDLTIDQGTIYIPPGTRLIRR